MLFESSESSPESSSESSESSKSKSELGKSKLELKVANLEPSTPHLPREGNGDTEDILGDFSSIVLTETSSKQVSPGELADKDALELRGLRFLLSLDELRAAEAGRKGETLDTLGECLNILRHDGFAVDMEMATVAIHVYARRNLVCHAKVGSADIAHHRLLDKEISSA
ncbi:hypothetical protein V8E54_002299 [Elaphomyces granulatus]